MVTCIRSLFGFLLAVTALPGAEPVDLARLLKGVEDRYNSVLTLELTFEQTYIAPNRLRRVESGSLRLRKPGRMRWEYTKPDGKLFISDGSSYWYYSVLARRAEKMKLKEAEDIQAPLAFLIGKLDFQRDFGKFLVQPADGLVTITAEPKNPQKSPFAQVAFTVGPDSRISTLTIRSQDGATMIFQFSSEIRNPALNDAIFTFVAPPGVEVVAGGER
jgi:outer membrane lipoprotein carrier protein